MLINHIKNHYIASFKDLREARNTIFFAVVIFLAGISLGYANPSWIEEGFSAMKDFAKQLSYKSMSSLISAIFLKNTLSAVISVVSGPLLGIASFFAAVMNGLLVGTTLSSIRQINRTAMIIQLFPHGLFELPAMFMAWGLGIWQGIWFFQKNKTDTLGERRKKAFRILLLIIVPLLLTAAIIEGASIHVALAGR